MAKWQSKDIKKLLSGWVVVPSVSSGTGSSIDITSSLTPALTTAGAGGTSVPFQVHTYVDELNSQQGINVIANKVKLYYTSNKRKVNVGGLEVFGRITVSLGVATVSFFTINNSGVETAHTFSSSSLLTLAVPYVFKFQSLPASFIMGDDLGTTDQASGGASGAMNYQGTWNANTNSPTLASSVGTKGYLYRVSTNGSTALDGITDWKVGDFVAFNGITWDKWDNTDSVFSVNGEMGAVSLTTDNIPEGTKSYFIPKGKIWSSRTNPADNVWNGVTYGNGMFVAVSGDGTANRVMTSPDGINWKSRTSVDNNWRAVTYGNGLFVAVSSTGTGNRVMTSPDGITWTARTSANDFAWKSITFGNGLFVAVAYSDTGGGNRVMTSPDGITWTARTSAASNVWWGVTYGNGLFVAVAQSGTGNRIMTSPDGITWTSRTNPVDNDWRAVAYGNGLFVAVSDTGIGNRIMTSPDGITWASRTNPVDNDWNSVTYGNGLFVAVAYSGTGNRVMTSPDGITWTARTSTADNTWSSVCYGNGVFVAVSENGTANRIMTSGLPEANVQPVNYTARQIPVDNSAFRQITSSELQSIAAGVDAIINNYALLNYALPMVAYENADDLLTAVAAGGRVFVRGGTIDNDHSFTGDLFIESMRGGNTLISGIELNAGSISSTHLICFRNIEDLYGEASISTTGSGKIEIRGCNAVSLDTSPLISLVNGGFYCYDNRTILFGTINISGSGLVLFDNTQGIISVESITLNTGGISFVNSSGAINIASNIYTLGSVTFKNCKESIYIGGNITAANITFINCTGGITIDGSITYSSSFTFTNCGNISFSGNLTKGATFNNCGNITFDGTVATAATALSFVKCLSVTFNGSVSATTGLISFLECGNVSVDAPITTSTAGLRVTKCGTVSFNDSFTSTGFGAQITFDTLDALNISTVQHVNTTIALTVNIYNCKQVTENNGNDFSLPFASSTATGGTSFTVNVLNSNVTGFKSFELSGVTTIFTKVTVKNSTLNLAYILSHTNNSGGNTNLFKDCEITCQSNKLIAGGTNYASYTSLIQIVKLQNCMVQSYGDSELTYGEGNFDNFFVCPNHANSKLILHNTTFKLNPPSGVSPYYLFKNSGSGIGKIGLSNVVSTHDKDAAVSPIYGALVVSTDFV